MFEIGWSELLVIAIVALIVFPTKDLPKLLRTVGYMVGRARRMAGDFQSQFNAALREAEREIDLSDGKSTVNSINPLADIRKTLDPLRAMGDDLKRSVTAAAVAPAVSPEPAVAVAPTAVAPVVAEPVAAAPAVPSEPAVAVAVAPVPADAPAVPVATKGEGV